MSIITENNHDYKATIDDRVLLEKGDKITIRIQHETDMDIISKNLRLMITLKRLLESD